MSQFRVTIEGWVGRTMFDPRLRGERRVSEIEAESEEEVRSLFQQAVEQEVPNVMGAGLPFKLVSIEPLSN